MKKAKAEQILERLKKSLIGEDCNILEMIVWKAGELFEECEEDFCVQATGTSAIVFGGTNRVVWSISHGFRCERSYCTEKFIKHFERIQS